MHYRIVSFADIDDPSDVDLNDLPIAQCGWFDGYPVGDRALEGVMIKVVTNKASDALELVFDQWPPSLAQGHFAPKLLEFAYQNDFFSSTEDANDDMIMIIKREDDQKPWRYNYED